MVESNNLTTEILDSNPNSVHSLVRLSKACWWDLMMVERAVQVKADLVWSFLKQINESIRRNYPQSTYSHQISYFKLWSVCFILRSTKLSSVLQRSKVDPEHHSHASLKRTFAWDEEAKVYARHSSWHLNQSEPIDMGIFHIVRWVSSHEAYCCRCLLSVKAAVHRIVKKAFCNVMWRTGPVLYMCALNIYIWF